MTSDAPAEDRDTLPDITQGIVIMKNWPTFVSVFATALGATFVSLGWLSAGQVGVIGALIMPAWTAIVHRMSPPA